MFIIHVSSPYVKKDISVYNVLKFAHNTLKKKFFKFYNFNLFFFTINWSFLFWEFCLLSHLLRF